MTTAKLGRWLLLLLLSIDLLHMAESVSVSLKLSPLIGGPSFLPVHVKVVVDEDHMYDFVPINPTNPITIRRLMLLQSVPGEIRSRGLRHSTSSNCCRLVKTAEKFVSDYDDTNLHLLHNNCWTFAMQLLWKLWQEARVIPISLT